MVSITIFLFLSFLASVSQLFIKVRVRYEYRQLLQFTNPNTAAVVDQTGYRLIIKCV